MNDKTAPMNGKAFPAVSPYLMRPLRTYEQALADIAAKKNMGVVTTFAPPASVGGKRRGSKSDLVAA